MSHLIDSWGRPLAFYRFPVFNAELDASNPNKATGVQARFRDPIDPAGLLMDPTWNNPTNYLQRNGVWAFEKLCHIVHNPAALNPPNWPISNMVPPRGYHVPVVA